MDDERGADLWRPVSSCGAPRSLEGWRPSVAEGADLMAGGPDGRVLQWRADLVADFEDKPAGPVSSRFKLLGEGRPSR